MRRLLPPLLVVLGLGLLAGASAAPAAPRLSAPRLDRLGGSTVAFATSTLSGRAARAIRSGPSWGGTYTTPSGVQLQILVSATYPEDQAVPAKWASFLDSLVHGPELGQLTVYLAPLAEVQQLCGADALACYSDAQNMLAAPGDAVDGVSAEAVVAHEYGHHVAAHRSNAPWSAVTTGTKRWASYEQVCSRAERGVLFPGAEDDLHYALNPGEAFAESYRVLNERRLGLPETAWEIVARSLYPDDDALARLQQDVEAPWSAAPPKTLRSWVNASAGKRTYPVQTPLDGALKVTLTAPAGARLAVDLYAGARRVGQADTSFRRTQTLQTTVCGTRAYRVVVTRISGAGTFGLSIAKS